MSNRRAGILRHNKTPYRLPKFNNNKQRYSEALWKHLENNETKQIMNKRDVPIPQDIDRLHSRKTSARIPITNVEVIASPSRGLKNE